MKLKDSLNLNGYDPEELYFHHINQELIQKFKDRKPRGKIIDIKEARESRDIQESDGSTSTALKKSA